MIDIGGGPAFPVLELDELTNKIHAQHMGVTLRDYFACAAMQAVIASPQAAAFTYVDRAKWAYAQADAMLKERG